MSRCKRFLIIGSLKFMCSDDAYHLIRFFYFILMLVATAASLYILFIKGDGDWLCDCWNNYCGKDCGYMSSIGICNQYIIFHYFIPIVFPLALSSIFLVAVPKFFEKLLQCFILMFMDEPNDKILQAFIRILHISLIVIIGIYIFEQNINLANLIPIDMKQISQKDRDVFTGLLAVYVYISERLKILELNFFKPTFRFLVNNQKLTFKINLDN